MSNNLIECSSQLSASTWQAKRGGIAMSISSFCAWSGLFLIVFSNSTKWRSAVPAFLAYNKIATILAPVRQWPLRCSMKDATKAEMVQEDFVFSTADHACALSTWGEEWMNEFDAERMLKRRVGTVWESGLGKTSVISCSTWDYVKFKFHCQSRLSRSQWRQTHTAFPLRTEFLKVRFAWCGKMEALPCSSVAG